MEGRDCNRIREIMAEQGRRYDWLAEKIGVSPNRLSRLLSGDMRWRVEEAIKAAEVLGLPVESLFLPECGNTTVHGGK